MLMQQSTVHGKYHRKTGYLLRNVHMVIGEFAGTGYCVDDMQMMQTIESQLMMSHGSCTKQLHKSIAHHAKQDDIMSKNGNDE